MRNELHTSAHSQMTIGAFDQSPCDIKPICCEGCRGLIDDRFFLQVQNVSWHERCLKCAICQVGLDSTCFFKNDIPYCKTDYERLFSGKCGSCFQTIPANKLVMRAGDIVYHLDCFSCTVCHQQLRKGDEFVLKNRLVYCKIDYEKDAASLITDFKSENLNSPVNTYPSKATPKSECSDFLSDEDKSSKEDELKENHDSYEEDDELCEKDDRSSGHQKPCRKRVILTTQQRRAFKAAFDVSSKPCRKVREQLARDTGLSVRVVQVWFQNERAKVKKLAKRQQQQHHSQLDQDSPHRGLEDVPFGMYIPDQFSSHMEIRFNNDIMSPGDPSIPFPPNMVPAINSEFFNSSFCSALPPISEDVAVSAADIAVPSTCMSEQPLKTVSIDSNMAPPTIMSKNILNPIDKLYSMQSSYFTQLS